jgi:hypothetical protein
VDAACRDIAVKAMATQRLAHISKIGTRNSKVYYPSIYRDIALPLARILVVLVDISSACIIHEVSHCVVVSWRGCCIASQVTIIIF